MDETGIVCMDGGDPVDCTPSPGLDIVDYIATVHRVERIVHLLEQRAELVKNWRDEESLDFRKAKVLRDLARPGRAPVNVCGELVFMARVYETMHKRGHASCELLCRESWAHLRELVDERARILISPDWDVLAEPVGLFGDAVPGEFRAPGRRALCPAVDGHEGRAGSAEPPDH